MKNARRRNDLDIVADILRVAQGGAKKTRIVYQANLNFKIVKGYLEGLLESDLLEITGPRYYPTDRATEFLEAYDNIVAFGAPAPSPILSHV